MTVIVDYGVGNLFSLISSLKKIGEEAIISGEKSVIENADRIILPGVGAFKDASNKLRESGLDKVLIAEAKKGKVIMGVCLGMQMLFEKSFENGVYDGLGLIKGEVKPISDRIEKGLKIPQIGWNALELKGNSPLFKYIDNGDYVYFVHSYFADTDDKNIIATTDYGGTLTASVALDNVYGCQFHPEKSGDVGLKILKAFTEL